MGTKFQKSIMLVGAIALSSYAFAQDNSATNPAPFTTSNSYRTWSLGVQGGVMTPVIGFGGKNDYSDWKIGSFYGGYIKKQLNHNIGVQADFFRGSLKADNDPTVLGSNPYRSFETEMKYGATLSAVLSAGNFTILKRQSYVTPYLSAGAGLIGYQPTMVTTAGTTVEANNGENLRALVVPVGLGLKFMLSKGVNLDLGYTMNFADADDLDGFNREPQTDKFGATRLGLEFALGNKNKSQLAFVNAAAVLEQNYIAKYDELKAQMDNRNNNPEVAALKDQVNKLMTDTDGDGVSDYYDKCPDTPKGTAVDGAGCPLPKMEVVRPVTYVITEEDKKIVTEAIKNLEFDFNKATIRPSSFPTLDRVADLLISKNLSLKLAGHTDSKGGDAYNMKLSKDRAESVKAYLVSKGVNASRIEATGYGETQPIDTNDTDAGRQNNRRVEFTLFN